MSQPSQEFRFPYLDWARFAARKLSDLGYEINLEESDSQNGPWLLKVSGAASLMARFEEEAAADLDSRRLSPPAVDWAALVASLALPELAS